MVASREHDCFECDGRGRVATEPTLDSYPFIFATKTSVYWTNLVVCPRCGGTGKEAGR